MTLTQLRQLVAIADSGLNITIAAERVHATQPGVSKQLKQLEDELGFRIFARKGKSLSTITGPGALVLQRARVILEQAADIHAAAANLRKEPGGELRIATTHTQARYVLPQAVASLKQRFPRVSVHLQPEGESDVLPRLHDGGADFAITSTPGTPPPGDITLPLYRWRRAVIVPRAHPLTRLRRALVLADLARHPLVSYESSLQPQSSLRRSFVAAGLIPQIACTARDADLIKTYVRAGLGVGVLAEMALLAEDAQDLKVLSADGLLPDCTTWLVMRRGRVLREFALAFIGLLAPHIDRRSLQRGLDDIDPPAWPPAPHWNRARHMIDSA